MPPQGAKGSKAPWPVAEGRGRRWPEPESEQAVRAASPPGGRAMVKVEEESELAGRGKAKEARGGAGR